MRAFILAFGIAVVCATISAVEGRDWPGFGGNDARTGNLDGQRGPLKPVELWRFVDTETQDMVMNSSPAIANGKIYIGAGKNSPFGMSGKVYCLDEKGNLLWQFRTAKWVFSSPAVANGRVYVGEGLHTDAPCKLYCLDAETGKEVWSFTTQSHTESSPLVRNGRVYFGAGDAGVYCVDAKDGKEIWHCPNIHVDLAPALDGNKLFVGTGYGKMGAICLNADTGKLIWYSPTNSSVWGSPVVTGGKVIYGAGNGNFREADPNPVGGVICFDVETGKRVWTQTLPNSVMSSIVLDKTRVYCGCRDGNVYAIGIAKGNVEWKTPCGGPVLANVALCGDQIFTVGGDQSVRLLSADSGKEVWRYDLIKTTGASQDELYSSPALAKGVLYFGTGKGNVIAIGSR